MSACVRIDGRTSDARGLDEREDLMATVLDDAARTAALVALDGWDGDRDAISRTVHIGTEGMDDFLAKLQNIAREMDHAPDLSLTDGDVTITMSTHSAGGVTELDIEYARRVDALLS
jgi:4a-hydroxytetrahydrobiopterin dehydratase